jgi:glycolate oxidase
MSLMVGAESTLGVITEITVRLRPLPPVGVTAVGYFDSVGQAGDAVRATAAAGLQPAALELVDRHCLRAVDAWKNMGLSAEADAVLLARFDEDGHAAEDGARRVVDLFRGAGSTWADRSETDEEAEMLFAARRLAFPALERLRPDSRKTSVCPSGQWRKCWPASTAPRRGTASPSPASRTSATATCIRCW